MKIKTWKTDSGGYGTTIVWAPNESWETPPGRQEDRLHFGKTKKAALVKLEAELQRALMLVEKKIRSA